MSRFGSAFGRLHYQIVLPLVLVAVTVGIVATIVAVLLLTELTDGWVDRSSDSLALATAGRIAEAGERLADVGALVTRDERVTDALARRDPGSLRAVLASVNRAVDADMILVLDRQGRVVAGVSWVTGVDPGDRPLGRDIGSGGAGSYLTFARVNDVDTVAAVRPLGAGGEVLVVADVLDDRLLKRVTSGADGLFGLYDDRGRLAARSPSVSDPVSREVFGDASHKGGLLSARIPEGPRASDTVKTGSGSYHLVSTVVTLPGDPSAAERRLVALMSTEVTDRATSTTIRLITMWSVFAVVLLTGLGVWIAQSVSGPLGGLAVGARRVAEGDFATKVALAGATEIRALGESFNQMTQSLRERTEHLTKKVLELATLYEMSRSLGSTFDLDELVGSVLESSLRIFDVESGYVSLRDRETGELVTRAIRGPREQRADAHALTGSMAEWVVREGRPLIFNPSTGGKDQQVDAVTGSAAAVSAPLMGPEGAIGAITVGTHDPAFRFGSEDVRLLLTVANHVAIAIGNIELFTSLQDAYLATVRSLAAAVDAKDTYTRGHSDGVAEYAKTIGEAMGLSSEQRIALEMAAYLHDIGKIGVKEGILLKPGRLTEDEMDQMRHHPLIGANILRPVAFPWPITPVVRHHHEHWDGRGYPAGLKGEEIPLLARILSVADAYEAMISDRPYRAGRDADEAIGELERCAGTQFDARVVDAFVKALRAHSGPVAESAGHGAGYERDEARAVFVALCDGMFTSYRRLGGPKLAVNLEERLTEAIEAGRLPFKLAGGRMSVSGGEGRDLETEVEAMREALTLLCALIERTSGATLVDHFYAEALDRMSERMRATAQRMRLRRGR